MADRFCFAHSEEGRYSGDYATREDAAAEAFAEDEDAITVYTGRVTAIRIRVPTYSVIEQVCEDVQEQCGDEVMGDWLAKVPRAQQDDLSLRLGEAFSEWLADNNLTPTFFGVEGIQSHRRSVPVVSVQGAPKGDEG